MNISKRKSLDDAVFDEAVESKRARIEDDFQDQPAQHPEEEDEEHNQNEGTQNGSSFHSSEPSRKSNRKRFFKNEAYPDETTGQRSFFPGLNGDLNDEDEDSDDTTSNALAYLRSVRTEASFIPNLLTAPQDTSSDPEDPYDAPQSRGFYSDGAYIAAAAYGPAPPPALAPLARSLDPQDAYHNRLRALFARARTALRAPRAAASTPGAQTHPLPPPNASTPLWTRALQTHDPAPAQLAALEPRTVLRLLRICTFMLKRRNVSQRQSAWMWALLALLDDVGTLVSEEVAVVRELGKRAVWVLCGFGERGVAEATARYEGEDGEKEGVDGDAGSAEVDVEEGESAASENDEDKDDPALKGASAPAPLAADTRVNGDAQRASDGICEDQVGEDEEVPNANTRATLSMILTVAGDFYGQRDLLEFREVWPANA